MIQAVANSNNQALQNRRLEEVSEEFEAFFYNAIFKSARSVSFESGLVKKSEGEKTFTEMLDYELSRIAAKNTKGGLKEILINFFRENYSPVEGKKYPKQLTGESKSMSSLGKLMA